MADRSVSLLISVVTETTKAAAGLDQAGKGVEVFGKKLDLGLVAKGVAAAGAIVGVTSAVIDMTKAAADDAAEQERLVQAIQANGAAHGDWQKTLDATIAKSQELAFTDTEVRDAMVPLVGVTQDVTKASDLLATAQDVARLSGVSLESAAKAVAKAQAGSATSLAKLVQVNAEGMTSTEVLTAAQKKAAGQAEAYGKTTKGQADSMSIGFDELQETIGAAFLPVLAAILPELLPVMQAFGKLIIALLPALTPLLKLLVKVLLLIAPVLTKIAEGLALVIGWVEDAIGAFADFLSTLGPVRDAAGFIGDLFAGGKSAGVPVAVVPTVNGRAVSVGAASFGMSSTRPTVRVSGSITHRIDDPSGALAGIPGGAAAVAAMLNRGTDATGLFRNLQHAAGIR